MRLQYNDTDFGTFVNLTSASVIHNLATLKVILSADALVVSVSCVPSSFVQQTLLGIQSLLRIFVFPLFCVSCMTQHIEPVAICKYACHMFESHLLFFAFCSLVFRCISFSSSCVVFPSQFPELISYTCSCVFS